MRWSRIGVAAATGLWTLSVAAATWSNYREGYFEVFPRAALDTVPAMVLGMAFAVRRRPSPALAASLAAVAAQRLVYWLLWAADPPFARIDVWDGFEWHEFQIGLMAILVACSAPVAVRGLRRRAAGHLTGWSHVLALAVVGVVIASALLLARWVQRDWWTPAVSYEAFFLVPCAVFVWRLGRSRIAAAVLAAVAAAGLTVELLDIVDSLRIGGTGFVLPGQWSLTAELALLTLAASIPLVATARSR
jgi:hypothetical protein